MWQVVAVTWLDYSLGRANGEQHELREMYLLYSRFLKTATMRVFD